MSCSRQEILPLPKPTPSPISAKTEVKITYPSEGATVQQTESVKGTSQAIPDGNTIWVVVFVPAVGRYYPQNYPADVQANGNWSSIAHIGVAKDTGLRFDILAVLANSSAQATFNNYLKEARDKSSYPGLEQLVKDVVVHDRITVTRK
jgi:hypothetical protein